MPEKSTAVAIYKNHMDVDAAIGALAEADFDIMKLSVVMRDGHARERVLGYYSIGDRTGYWGIADTFWDGLWGSLAGSAFLVIPGIGPVAIAGPLVGWLAESLDGAVIVGGLSALGAALYINGLPKDSILRYENALHSDRLLLVYHGTHEEAVRAQAHLNGTAALLTEAHQHQQLFALAHY